MRKETVAQNHRVWTLKDENNMRATVYQVNVRPAIDRPTITTELWVAAVKLLRTLRKKGTTS